MKATDKDAYENVCSKLAFVTLHVHGRVSSNTNGVNTTSFIKLKIVILRQMVM